MPEHITLSIYADNMPGVLQRITALFTRRKLNIESLTVSETEREGMSRFTIVVCVDEDIAQKIAKQLGRIVEVEHVAVAQDKELLFREVALMRIACEEEAAHLQIEEISRRFSAHIEVVNLDSVVISKMGSESDIRCLLEVLKPFGLLEFIRSGRIAMNKSGEDMELGDFTAKQRMACAVQ